MSNTYYAYENKNNSLKDVNEEIEKEIAEVNETEEIDEVEEVEETEEIDEVEEEEEEDTTVVGTVTGCQKLNVRAKADIKAEVVCQVSEKAVLLIDTDESTDEWYKIYTEAGMEGFCMKKYVTVSK